MAYIELNNITGCTSPVTGNTEVIFDVKYNTDKIVSYYKRNINKNKNNNWINQFVVVVVFENYTQNFVFETDSDRNNFYNILP